MTCLRCKHRLAKQRGNCNACLAAVRRLVKAGLTTDEIEVAAGRRLASDVAAGRRRWSGVRTR